MDWLFGMDDLAQREGGGPGSDVADGLLADWRNGLALPGRGGRAREDFREGQAHRSWRRSSRTRRAA